MSMLTNWATGRNILILLALFLLANLVLIPAFYPKFATLDMLPSYTPDQAYQHLASYGAAGRQLYLVVELTLDVVYPLVAALLFSLMILYSFQRGFPGQSWTRWLALLPLAELATDYLENACIVVLLVAYPTAFPMIARIANIFTVAKFALTPLELIFVIGLIAWLVRVVRRDRQLRLAH